MASWMIPALAALPLVSAKSLSLVKLDTCSTDPIESCSSDAGSVSTCCVNRPGGQFLQTQFWDTDPVTGPEDSWTIHGLWPDHCDGDYDEGCDSSREYSDLTSILESNGKSDLVSYLKDYMQSNNGSPESFWDHEWSTHGTCVSTLEPDCYDDYEEGQEAADYFQILVDLFKSLDTYTALKDAGITPSSDETYSADEIASALREVTGKDVVLSCNSGELYQVAYGFFVNGPIINADFIASDVVGQSSNCPDTVKYLPKNGSNVTKRS
ncbi:putative ribonuclease T2 [Poronia punctata]|nr:putative ribonuclease T2 [Poronia punctata]